MVSLLISPANVQPTPFYVPQASSFGLETPTIPFEPNDTDSAPKQNFYPYSVIPGGADSASELRNAIANDSTVRAHYADFVVANARVERLKAPQAFYVSYRVGNSIFWTKSALTIRAGETVLSDGSHLARTRCGNRLSAVPVAPVAAIQPVPEAMEVPAAGPLLATIAAPAEIPVTPVPQTQVAAPPPIPPVSPVGIFLPLPPYLPVGIGGSSTPGTPVSTPPGPPSTPPAGPPTGTPTGPPTTVPPAGPPSGPPSGGSPTTPAGPPPVPAPEPSALLLVAVGFGCLLLRSKLR